MPRPYPTEQQLHNAAQLSRHLRHVAPIEFNMTEVETHQSPSTWYSDYGMEAYGMKEALRIVENASDYCGTARCVMGWAIELFNTKGVRRELTVKENLGLSTGQLEQLCFDGYDMTAKQKAKQLDEMVEHNKVHGIGDDDE